MHLRIRKPGFCPLLIRNNKEARAYTHAKETSRYKERGRLHLRSEAAHAEPSFPLVLKLVADRHDFRLVLSEERVFALHDTRVIRNILAFCRLNQCVQHVHVRYSRVLDWRIFAARAFHTDCTARDDDVAAQNVFLHTAACSDADKCVHAALRKLFYCYCGRWPADSC